MKGKRGQMGGGLVTGLIFGIVALVIAVIIGFVIVGTLGDAGLLEGNRASTTVTNESGWLNDTDYTLAQVTAVRTGYSISEFWVNTSTEYELVTTANYSLSTAGVVSRVGTEDYSDALITYSYLTRTSEELATDNLRLNFSAGIDEVSQRIPTVLLIAAIVLILGVLAVLVAIWQRMRLGGGSL